MNVTWEESVFAGLEELDQEGQQRVSQLAGPNPRSTVDTDEPKARTGEMPELGELVLAAQPPRLA